ncbi:MAG: hypothetical protein ACO20V_08250, partial [Alphaproteobacteria bacterium]
MTVSPLHSASYVIPRTFSLVVVSLSGNSKVMQSPAEISVNCKNAGLRNDISAGLLLTETLNDCSSTQLATRYAKLLER